MVVFMPRSILAIIVSWPLLKKCFNIYVLLKLHLYVIIESIENGDCTCQLVINSGKGIHVIYVEMVVNIAICFIKQGTEGYCCLAEDSGES